MGVPFQSTDTIDLVSYSSTAVSFFLRVNIRRKDGEVVTWKSQVHTTNSDRTQAVTNGSFLGIEGDIEGVVIVRASSDVTIPKRGQCYVLVQLERGEGQAIQTLAADYWYDPNAIVLGRIVPPGPGGGEGFIRTVTGTDRAAGLEVSEAVPTNAMWKLLSFGAVLVTDATAVTRGGPAWLILDDGTTTNRRAIYKNSNTQIESLTRTWLWTLGNTPNPTTASDPAADTQTVLWADSMVSQILSEGGRIRTIMTGLVAGDNYAAPIFQVEEWIVI